MSGVGALYGDDLSQLVELARRAEGAGIDQLVMTDHVIMGERTDRYPYGRFPFPLDEPWPEPLTTLAAMAGATRRIRLGTGVLIAPLRPAVLLAKSLASLDALSQGRLDLGVGVGWQPEEFQASGIPFAGRFERLDDTLRACRTLWSEAPASFQSETVRFEKVWCLPQPVQEGGIPIWFGLGLSERNLSRMVELGAGWMPMESDPAEIRAGRARIETALRTAGRDPAGFGIRAHAPLATDDFGRPDLQRTLQALPALEEAGATVASFALAAFARRPEQVDPFLNQLGRSRA